MNSDEMAGGQVPPNAIRHGSCDSWWTGLTVSHCASCCRTFSSISAFDHHQAEKGCLHPAEVDLIPRWMPYGICWGWPGEHPRSRDAVS